MRPATTTPRGGPARDLPPGLPAPLPTPDDAPFWAACAQRRLVLQSCRRCRRHQHPPGPRCTRCGGDDLDWPPAPAGATVFSYTVVRHAMHPAVADAVPYVVALVAFDGIADLRLLTDLVDVDPDEIRIGLPVRLVWGEAGGVPVPRFSPRGGGA